MINSSSAQNPNTLYNKSFKSENNDNNNDNNNVNMETNKIFCFNGTFTILTIFVLILLLIFINVSSKK
jgi:hypothetical protein